MNIIPAENDRVKKRESNIELLRIVLMVMIVLHHLVYHGGLFNNANRLSYRILYGLMLPGGKIGFCCFIVISAYFSTDSKFKGSKFIRTALQVVFYNLVLMGLSSLLGGEVIEPITWRNWIGCVFPVFGNSHGFARAYLIFLLILPMLQIVGEKMSPKNIQALLLIIFGMQIWQKVLSVIANYTAVDFENEMSVFIAIYFIVVWLKKRPLNMTNSKIVMSCSLSIIWLTVTAANIVSTEFPNVEIIKKAMILINSEFSPLNIAAGFCLFFLLKNINIKQNNIINSIATHTFGVLLIHDSEFFTPILWHKIFKVEMIYNSSFTIIICYLIGVTMTVFIVGIFVDSIRKILLERCIVKTNLFNKTYNNLEKYIKI